MLPTEDQLANLNAADMRLICDMTSLTRRHLKDTNIIGWIHRNEPDNLQLSNDSKTYGPPEDPTNVTEEYATFRLTRPTKSSVEKRLTGKRIKSEIKQNRQKLDD